MKRPLALIVGCVIVLHLFSLEVAADTIQAVEIRGHQNVSEDKIRRIIRLKPGDAYTDEAVAEAVKNLFATKEFADIQALKEVQGLNVVVTFVVKENTKVEEVKFEGNKHVDDEDLAAATTVKGGVFLRPSLLRNDHSAIEDIYREKGYYRVAVKDKIDVERDKQTKRTRNILVYEVHEGEKVSVKHIDFFGTRALDSGTIKKVLETKEDRWYRGAEFKPKVLDEDMARIAALYRERGFLDIEIKGKELEFSKNGKGLDIFVTLVEGTQYKVGDVTWSGNTVFNDVLIGNKVTLRKGDIFNDSEFAMVQQGIGELYWDRGYIFFTVSPEKKVKGDVIDVNFEITEGKPAHVHEINIAGNTKTSERVIRRELMLNPGDVFLRSRLMRSVREVFSLGFFNAPRDPTFNRINDEGDIDITINVEEKQTGQFRLGAGFSSLNSISGFIGVQETNFLGRGQTVGIDWEFSRYRQNIDLNFTEPWLLGTPTELNINIFNRLQDQVRQQFYSDQRRGISTRIGRPFPWFDYTSIFLRYRYEWIDLSNFSLGYTGPLLTIKWPQRTSSIALTLMRNSTDSPFRPTTGTRTSLTTEFNGGQLLGGDVTFQRYEASFQWYQTLVWKLVLEMRYSVGMLDGYGSPSEVPDYERYRLGGNRLYGVRGYDFYEIVPEGNPLYLGGRYMQILSYVVSIPLAQNVIVLGFFDSGNTWNSATGADPLDMKKGVGFGIRIDMPMLGTIGFDYGYGFDKLGGAGWEPHLTLGAGF